MEPMGAIVFLPREDDSPSLMLEEILFDSAAAWLSAALERAGVGRFLVVCHNDDREGAERCFPAGTEFVTEGAEDAAGLLLSFLSALEGRVAVFTRPVFLSDEGALRLTRSEELPRGEDAGVYRIGAQALKAAVEDGGDFVTSLRDLGECFGLSDSRYMGLAALGNLDRAQILARRASVERMVNVRMMDRDAVYIGPRVTVGEGSSLLPGTILRGRTAIGRRCEIGPNSMVRDCIIGDCVTVNASQLNESTVEDGVKIGPFAYIRPGCQVGAGVKVGDFVELKNSTIGAGTKISHLTYVGDSDVGGGVNFGCGTVTVNYDGAAKYRTVIGDNAFIGCNTNLVAPVRVGDGAYTAAGSTITDDVPADSLAIARSVQTVKKQWAAKRRKRLGR